MVALALAPQHSSFNEQTYAIVYNSFDLDGTIVNYAWNWGDGATTSGLTSSRLAIKGTLSKEKKSAKEKFDTLLLTKKKNKKANKRTHV